MTDATTLRIERVIDASPERVFRAWTTAEAMERWYEAQPGWEVKVTELDLRVGGRYRIQWGPPGAEPYAETGEYLEIDPPHRLVMTETLHVGQTIGWHQTTVTVELHDDGGKTRMVLTHRGFGSSTERDQAAGGWPHFLDRMERLITEG